MDFDLSTNLVLFKGTDIVLLLLLVSIPFFGLCMYYYLVTANLDFTLYIIKEVNYILHV